MVSSTVYGIEETLEQVYSSLKLFGYDVWMSAQGTLRTFSQNHAFDDCLDAVNQCDLFFSIITPQYGSGVLRGENGITHRELSLAIDRDVPRWVMAHERVVIARSIFRKFGCRSIAERSDFLNQLGYDDPKKFKDLISRENKVLDDFRVIDMYDEAIRDDVEVAKRRGNWVQSYSLSSEILRYVEAQLGDYDFIKSRVDGLKKTQRAAAVGKSKRASATKKATKKRTAKAVKKPSRRAKR